jgi:Putative periplasmic protein kinase ArgK and related GTPases of G3E family
MPADDLQAIKKGIVELADLVVVNKADLDPKAAEFAKHQFENALGLLRSTSAHWRPKVLTLSAQTGAGVADFWAEIERHRKTLEESGELAQKRRRQAVDWMWTLIDAELRNRFRHHAGVKQDLEKVSRAVTAGSITPAAAAHRLLEHLNEKP